MCVVGFCCLVCVDCDGLVLGVGLVGVIGGVVYVGIVVC